MIRVVARALLPVAVMLALADVAAATDGRRHAPPNLAKASVIWSGNFETGDLSQWWGPQAADSEPHPGPCPKEGAPGDAGEVCRPLPGRPGRYECGGEWLQWRARRPSDPNVHDSRLRRSRAMVDLVGIFLRGTHQFYAGSWNIFTSFHHTGDTGQVPVTFEVHNLAPRTAGALPACQ